MSHQLGSTYIIAFLWVKAILCNFPQKNGWLLSLFPSIIWNHKSLAGCSHPSSHQVSGGVRHSNAPSFEKQSLLHCLTMGSLKQLITIDTAEPEIAPFLFNAFFFLFKTWQLHYPQCHLGQVTSLVAIYQITCSFLWSHKSLYTHIHISHSPPQEL